MANVSPRVPLYHECQRIVPDSLFPHTPPHELLSVANVLVQGRWAKLLGSVAVPGGYRLPAELGDELMHGARPDVVKFLNRLSQVRFQQFLSVRLTTAGKAPAALWPGVFKRVVDS